MQNKTAASLVKALNALEREHGPELFAQVLRPLPLTMAPSFPTLPELNKATFFLDAIAPSYTFDTHTARTSVDPMKTKTKWYAAITPKVMISPTQHPPKYANLKNGSITTHGKFLIIIPLLTCTRPALTAL
ncbi:MAG: hypothetical protein PUB42_00135 [Firmicutes bacterium]|nr:hypothetical protein [Bacillota bacterium]